MRSLVAFVVVTAVAAGASAQGVENKMITAADCTAGVACALTRVAEVLVDFRQPPHNAAAMNINNVVRLDIR